MLMILEHLVILFHRPPRPRAKDDYARDISNMMNETALGVFRVFYELEGSSF